MGLTAGIIGTSKPREFIPMRPHHLALLVSLAMPLAVWAMQPAQSFQPMEAGVQPLFDRLAEIRSEQRALSKKRDSIFIHPESKARAQADYQALEKERQCIEKEIMQSTHLRNTGLVNYALQMDTRSAPFDSGALRQTD